MKNSDVLLVAIVLSAILFFLQSCDATGQDDECERVLCTKDYRQISLKLVYPDGQPVLLDSSKVFWVSQNRYLEQNTASWNEDRVFGNYHIVNDGILKELRNKEEMICFTGYLNGDIVCNRDLLVGADCCHVYYLGSKSLVQIIPYMESGCGFDEVHLNEGLWLKMDDKSVVHTSDIDFYDVSSHMIYLKHELSYLDKVSRGGLISMYVGNHKIYDCSFHSRYSSSLPTGAFIYTNSLLYPKDILRIGFIQILNENLEPTKTDPRNDERIIRALKKYGQYHEGLNCKLRSYMYSKGKLVFNIELSNPDTFDYYYLDPDKMGFGLFHYFTNGPTFWSVKDLKTYTHQGTITQPDPWNSWKKEWLSLIKSGEHKNITITYDQFEIMPAGQYRMNFEFPGLYYGITQQDRVLKDGRIWMGSCCIEEMVTI